MANIMRLGGGNSKVKIVNVGSVDFKNPKSYSGTLTATIDIKSKVDDYSKITANNIICGLKNMYAGTNEDGSTHTSGSFAVSYSNGIITVKYNYSSSNYWRFARVICDVYVVEGNVERI